MLFFGKKKGAKLKGNVARMEAYQTGHVACQNCGFLMPLSKLKPLLMVECPQCHTINLVPLKIGDFWLFEPLGGGAMGSVYKACSSLDTSKFYAVKVLPRLEKNRPALVQTLLSEACVAKIIGNHPCLVNCVASGYADGEYYCALECVEGDRVDKLVEREGRMTEKAVLQFALHLLAAEKHIYKCGYLYRDLKPENIIINREGFAVLLDYGLCITREKALQAGDEFIAGSPYYLPPERLWGTGEDAYSEIYSLGMVMYYALAGQTYYDAAEVESLAKRHVSNVRVSIASKLKNFRPELVEVLGTMIKQEAEDRYQTFGEATQALQKILSTAPSKRDTSTNLRRA